MSMVIPAMPLRDPMITRHSEMMLVKQFKFKRNNDRGGFQWTAHSEIERPGFYRGFTAVGKTLADVKDACVSGLAHWNAYRRCTHPDSKTGCRRHGVATGICIKENGNERHRRLQTAVVKGVLPIGKSLPTQRV